MNAPPKKRPPATLAGANGGNEANRISTATVKQDGQKFKGDLWPVNVTRMHSAGVRHEWRRNSHDIVTECPACCGRLVIDEAKPYWMCTGNLLCAINRIPFSAVLKSLVEKVGSGK